MKFGSSKSVPKGKRSTPFNRTLILPVNFDTIGTVELPRHTDSDRIVPVLLDLAQNDPHIRVRTEAAASLGHLDSPAARRALIQLLERK